MKNRIGIIGGGQLARMLIFEAKKMGFFVTVIDPTPASPGGQVADRHIIASLDDEQAMRELAQQSDYITFDWELANPDLLEQLEKSETTVNPSPTTLRIIKDKLKQKEFLQKNNIPVAPFLEVTNKDGILKAEEQFGYPLVLKTRTGGYDGKGNAVITKEKEIDAAMEKLNNSLLYVEKYIPFVKEISIMIARNTLGDIDTYPVAENIHKNNILHTTIVPARVSNTIKKKAEQLAIKVVKHLDGAGVFGIEMFVTKTGKVLINEIAPRVHNSGHYTIEASYTSQFAQHIRAITGLPLGKTAMITPSAVMVNMLGERTGDADVQGIDKALRVPNVFVHLYGKQQTKPERKMGHVTAIGTNVTKTLENARKARKYITI